MDRDIFLESAGQGPEWLKPLREQELFVEFTMFLYHYMQSKKFLNEGFILDSYSSSIKALHHWAATEIIEHGEWPDKAVWQRVRKINPGIHKLYEELTESQETVELRIQLIVLACEFAVSSKLKVCCGLLLELLESREEPWSMEKFAEHPMLSGLTEELPAVLQKLVSKSLIREVAVVTDESWSRLELSYTAM
ncbi:hypothetical protein [Paenibacillus gansuensis]|uniref:YgxA-like substrate binding domain-containing protein n=1 Tax=Paenibacillus gansuensis TaxID=306542 RepID=A0ABW5PKW9_9BACL